jgi:hypothetical protein
LAKGLDPECRSGGLEKGKERKGGERQTLEGRARLLHISRFIASELFRFPLWLRVRVRLWLQIVGVEEGRRRGESDEPRSEWG